MSRPWCPTVVADADSLASLVDVQRKAKRAASPGRDVSQRAAVTSVAASATAAEVVSHNSRTVAFGGSVSMSTLARQRMWENGVPPSDLEPALASVRAAPKVASLDCRTIPAGVEALKKEHARGSLSFTSADVTTDAVKQLLEDAEACRMLSGLELKFSVRGFQTLQTLFEAMNRDPEVYRKYHLALLAAEEARRQRDAARALAVANGEEPEGDTEEVGDEEAGAPPLPPVDVDFQNLLISDAAFAVGENSAVVEELAKYVSRTTALVDLQLPRCGLSTSASVLALTAALLNNRSVTHLSLAGNGIGRDEESASSVDALAKLLQESKFLLNVSLRDNDFSAAHCKLFAEALANSDTRVATPEPEPEPEVEPYVDDLGEPEEAPQVKIGFPEEEKTAEKEADDATPEAQVAEAEDVAPPAKEAENDGEDEEDDEVEAKQEAPAAASPDPIPEEDDEDDEEKAEERRRVKEEKEAAEQAAREEAEAQWRDKMETFIWGPERTHFEYSEYTARRAVAQLHVTQTTALKEVEKQEKVATKSRQLERQRKDRERRSGWSHLKVLDLAGNPVASDGAVALASMLRHRIPLPPMEAPEQADADAAAEEEPAAADPAAQGDEEDAEAEAAESGTEQRAPADAPTAAEIAPVAAPPAAAPAPTFKPGMSTLNYLDLTNCGIGAKGATALFNTAKDNADSLRALLVAKNKFALKHRLVRAIESGREAAAEAEGDDGEEKEPVMRREVISDWASPALEALRECVATNTTLKILDLSHNHLFPLAVRTISIGLKANSTLTTLRLDGNPICHQMTAGEWDLSGFDALFAALPDMRLHALGLAGTNLGEWLRRRGDPAVARALFSIPIVDLARCGLDAAAVAVLNRAVALVQHVVSQSLLLANNSFEASDTDLPVQIGALISKLSRRLETIDLSDNPNVGDGALRHLAKEAFVDLPVLKRLYLRRTRAGSSIAIPFKKVLHSATFLQEFDLSDCNLDIESAATFVTSVTESTTLRRFAMWSRTQNLAPTVLPLLVGKIPRSLQFVDLGVRLPRGEEPDDDNEESFLVEDLEAALLKNRLRALSA